MMGMRMGPSMTHRMKLRHEIRLNSEIVLGLMFQARMQLVQALHDETYEPKAQCPSCAHELTAVEILKGFNRDPADFTTGCPKCKERFSPRLICFGPASRLELPFYCSAQVLEQMGGLHTLPPDEFARLHPAIYRSAIAHHGSIRNAFAQLGADYPFGDISGWESKAASFLGQLPDTVIAQCVGKSPRVIRRMRRKAGIRAFSKRRMVEELGDIETSAPDEDESDGSPDRPEEDEGEF
jgi:hypothetical protein